MNLYSRKHVLEGARIDVKMAELKKELEAAKKLPAVTGYDEEQKNYYSFQMCIRDSSRKESAVFRHVFQFLFREPQLTKILDLCLESVSYTHLPLPLSCASANISPGCPQFLH